MTENGNAPLKLPRVVTTVAWLVLVVASFWLLYVGRPILIPLILAALALYLMEILTGKWMKLRIGGAGLPRWAANLLSLLVILLMAWGFFSVIADNAAQVAKEGAHYQQRLLSVYDKVMARFGFEGPEQIDQLFDKLNMGAVLSGMASGIGGLLNYGVIVLLFIFFLMLEKKFLQPKLNAIFKHQKDHDAFLKVWSEVDRDIRTYLGVKTFVSLLVAGLSYAVMRILGINFSEFWALLIFLFNFIPNIGSLIATAMPVLLAVVQFPTLREATIALVAITACQMTVGNILEPQLMGRSLNLSPFVVIFSLVFWGSLWGIAGMFLCVPIAVVTMIICSHFDSTRWLAVLLSKDGTTRTDQT
jgi:AI-2 transport protein TqsA